MAPEVEIPMTLSAARTRATEGNGESQDSQAVMAAMHRFHGIGVTSSSPIDPLDYDNDLIQHFLQQPRPPKVHRQHLESAHVARLSKSKSKAWAKSASRDMEKKNPAATATTGNKGSGHHLQPPADKGLDSPGTVNPTATPANLIPSSQTRPTDASIGRVSSFSPRHLATSPSRSSRQPIHKDRDIASAPPIDQTNHLPCHCQSPSNETIPSSLSAAPAAIGYQVANPALQLSLGNDATNTQEASPTIQRSVWSPLKKTSPEKKGRSNKMASSPSSTQSNDGRSYEQYLPRGDDLISSDPIRQPRFSRPSRQVSPLPGNTEAPIQDDDTGQVEFHFSDITRNDTQNSVSDSIRTGPVTQEQHAMSDYVFDNPETPAAPRNPFWETKPSALMASSQMFKQTQYSSAFKGTFSPTSSRPSPDNLHLNSISPNPSPLKRVTTGPSPLQGASRLPQLPPVYDTSPQQADEDDTPACEDEIATSHMSKSFRGSALAPIERYRPVSRWDIRAASAQPGSDMEDDPDEDMSDEEERRRQRAALKRAKAKKRLEAIPFEREPEEAVVPATNQEDMSPAAQLYLDQCEGVSRRDSQNSPESLHDPALDATDSQDEIVQLSVDLPGQPSAGENVSSNDVVPNTDPRLTSAPVQTDDELAVQVPETSPAHLRALGDMMPQSSEELSKPGSFGRLLSSPLTSTPIGALLGPTAVSRSPQQRTKDAVDAGGEDSGVDADNNAGDSCIIVSSSPPAPASRASLRGGRPHEIAPPTSSTSPLSRLTTTPELSNKTTPLTEESPRGGLTPSSTSTGEADSSPAVAKVHRQNAKPKPAKTKLRTYTRRTTRQSFPSNISVSTDELAGSPGPSTPTEQNARLSRVGRALLRESPASRNNSRGETKIFTGMAFAISFQGKQPGEKEVQYKARMSTSAAITAKIKQAGGKVLPDGFDHLFEFAPVKNADREATSLSSTPHPDDDVVLAPQARDTGFTALIADGHSRKVKYMQALALGLPCLHERWITACVDKQRLVDWADYLLCAGNSSFLGDAIRSRNLSTYDAATAKLGEVIQYRPRLLDQSRILLLMTRADESRKAAYVFLARVLGASLSRVYTAEEARRQLKAREDAGRAFDWVYVVDEKVPVDDIFLPLPPGGTEGSRKRKRRSEAGKGDASMAPPAKRVRALSDELVIQSLILGRLMEEGEMKATVG